MIKRIIRKIARSLDAFNILSRKREIDTLYALLYQLSHDLDNAVDLSSLKTSEAFAKQWANLKEGKYLLSDPAFKNDVDRILCEDEIQVKREWFQGKNVLDAGCGNGRWSYGLAKLGCNITAMDINKIALEETEKAIAEFDVKKEFIHSPLERAAEALDGKKFDLVFSWGVLHHCQSFTESLSELVKLVKDDGILYLYLYGRESLSLKADLELFKKRLYYNMLPSEDDKYKFLLNHVYGDKNKVHNAHDIYAPLVNRRLEWQQMVNILKNKGFSRVDRTIEHSELFIRATKDFDANSFSPKVKPPYWFEK